MTPSSRQFYRHSRLLLALSAIGLVAAALLPAVLAAGTALAALLGALFALVPFYWLALSLRLRRQRRQAPEQIGALPAVLRNLLLSALLWPAGALALQRAAARLRHVARDNAARLQAEQLERWRGLPLPATAATPADCPALARLAAQPSALCDDAMGHRLTLEIRDGKPALVAPYAPDTPPVFVPGPNPSPNPSPSPSPLTVPRDPSPEKFEVFL